MAQGGAVLRRRDYLQEFSAYLIDELGRSPRTAQAYVFGVKSLERFTGKRAEKLTTDDLRRFKRESDSKPATIQQAIVSLRQFHKWGAMEGYWALNGIMAVPTPQVRYEVQPPVPIATARMLLEEAQTDNEKRVIYLGLYAGCRISESAHMTGANVHGDRLIFIGKGSKKRTVPIHEELQRRLPAILRSQPSSEGVLQSALAGLRKRLDARDGWGRPVRSHALRRTFATALYDSGVPYEVLAKILGHGMDVTSRYARIRYETMADAVRRLTYYEAGPVQLTLFGGNEGVGTEGANGDGGLTPLSGPPSPPTS